jgi:hypothetical protein
MGMMNWCLEGMIGTCRGFILRGSMLGEFAYSDFSKYMFLPEVVEFGSHSYRGVYGVYILLKESKCSANKPSPYSWDYAD